MKKFVYLTVTLMCIGCGLFLALKSANWSWKGLLITPSQEYQYYINKQEYNKAAEVAVDPMQKGSSLYLAGEFKQAAAIFGSTSSVEAIYNRANSYVMLGKYDLAISDYEKVLQMRPDWQEAADNLQLALARKEKMAPPEDDFGGTGGMLGADEIVIGDRKNTSSEANEDNSQQDNSQLSKNEQQALWLKKVQTKPADFLRLKFSYQLTHKEQ